MNVSYSIYFSHDDEIGVYSCLLAGLGLIRFIPRSNKHAALIGQPVLRDLDVGLATYEHETVKVDVFTGTSILEPGVSTGSIDVVHRLLPPLTPEEVGTIRCIGFNVSRKLPTFIPGSTDRISVCTTCEGGWASTPRAFSRLFVSVNQSVFRIFVKWLVGLQQILASRFAQ